VEAHAEAEVAAAGEALRPLSSVGPSVGRTIGIGIGGVVAAAFASGADRAPEIAIKDEARSSSSKRSPPQARPHSWSSQFAPNSTAIQSVA
jgi:hypothetical protein